MVKVDSLFDGFFAVFCVIAIIVGLVSTVTVINEWQECSDRGGRMVQGLSWNGYVCVEGK